MLCGCAGKNGNLRSSVFNEPIKESQVIRLSVKSDYMGRKMPCMVYLPKSYGGGKEYPVWYGLNGYSSNENMWIENGGVADDGKIGERNMDQFVCKELVPYIDSHYHTVKSADGRYIGGFSMGGMIALRIAFHHTDMFSKVGGYSAAVISSDYSGRQLEEWLFPNDNVDGVADIADFDKEKGLDKLNVFLDAGNSNDPFSVGLQSLYDALQKRGITSEFHLYDGGHTLRVSGVRGYLKFYAAKE